MRKFFFVSIMFVCTSAFADSPRWVAPPKQDTFKRFKKVWTPFDKATGTYSFLSADRIMDGDGLPYTYLQLSKPFDGDDTNCCYGTYVNAQKEVRLAVCVLSEMKQSSCAKVEPDKCAMDKSIVEGVPPESKAASLNNSRKSKDIQDEISEPATSKSNSQGSAPAY